MCLLLVVLIAIGLGRTLNAEFVNYDDPETVYQSTPVVHGVTTHSLGWAFRHSVLGHWIPLTTISHMVDCQLYGLKPWGHHLTNLLLHCAASMLLFSALWKMTDALWRSAFVAALFAIHPMHVESVAWITERKGVLSGVFFMLSLGTYVRYTRHPTPARYAVVMLCFALALLSKAKLMTLPVLLLLLDYWPLQRTENPRRLILEKVPLLLLTLTSAVVQLATVRGLFEKLPISGRIGNALVSYATYLSQLLWPTNMAVFYPHPGMPPLPSILGASTVLVVVSVVAVVQRCQRPYLLVGWLWFLISMLPVIGLTQIGEQARADRYTYIPYIGLFFALVWAMADLSKRWRFRREILVTGSVAILLVCLALTHRQAGYWQNSETLFRHALAVTQNNYLAHQNLGNALSHSPERLPEEIAAYEAAIRIKPGYPEAHYNLGNALRRIPGKQDEVLAHYATALQNRPGMLEAHNNAGIVLSKIPGRESEAIAHYEAALKISPDYADAHVNLGNTLAKTPERQSEALAHYEAALRIDPDFFAAHLALANLLQTIPDRRDEATAEYEAALRLNPNHFEAHYNLGVLLLRASNFAASIPHFEAALRVNPNSPEAHNNTGIALSKIPARHAEAIPHFESALRLKPDYKEAERNLRIARRTLEQ